MLLQEVDSRYLDIQKLSSFLQKQFGNDFEIEEAEGRYRLTIPRALTPLELRAVGRYRELAGEAALARTLKRSGKPGTESPDLPVGKDATDNETIANLPSADDRSPDGSFTVPGLKFLFERVEVDVRFGPLTLSRIVTGSWEHSEILQPFKPSGSSVYRARITWTSPKAQEYRGSFDVKVAWKKLPKWTTQEQFLVELEAYMKVKTSDHPNIVVLLGSFLFEEDGTQLFSFIFPLALGTFKQLFRGSKDLLEDADDLDSLWSQFEGLSSALEYLHNECETAHRDIKPSNILIYRENRPFRATALVAKITDFGLATNLHGATTWSLGTEEAQSALKYDAPQFRRLAKEFEIDPSKLPTAGELVRNDIWKMGCVFLELSTFLLRGHEGIGELRRSITRKPVPGDPGSIGDNGFDDGRQVKPEVLQWISDLAQWSTRAAELKPLLKRMLDVDEEKLRATDITRDLREMTFCPFWDGYKYIYFTNNSRAPPISFSDGCKQAIERALQSDVNWWPLEQGLRSLAEDRVRLTWKAYKNTLHVHVPEKPAQDYRAACKAPSQCPPDWSAFFGGANHPILPRNSGDVPRRAVDEVPTGFGSSSKPPMDVSLSPTAKEVAESATSTQARRDQDESTKELYWCIDINFADDISTRRSTVGKQNLLNDQTLFEALIRGYEEKQKWWRRIFSFKECATIDFIKFYALYNVNRADSDKVKKVDTGLPKDETYEYEQIPNNNDAAHQAIAAELILDGIKSRKYVPADSSQALQMIPKHKEGISTWDLGTEGWGIRGRQGWSFWKILLWIILCAVLGVAFAIFWLVHVDHKGITNALAPLGLGLTILTFKFSFEAFLTTPTKQKQD